MASIDNCIIDNSINDYQVINVCQPSSDQWRLACIHAGRILKDYVSKWPHQLDQVKISSLQNARLNHHLPPQSLVPVTTVATDGQPASCLTRPVSISSITSVQRSLPPCSECAASIRQLKRGPPHHRDPWNDSACSETSWW